MKGSSTLPAFDKLELFPIGSIYTSINSTSPATLFGGTWEQIQGRFLLSASSSYAAGGTGGASTVNLSHVHSTGNHTLTLNQIPYHNHHFWCNIQHGDGEVVSSSESMKTGLQVGGRRRYTDYTDSAGGGGAHNHGNTGSNLSSSQSIMPPYLVVYMWKRTA